MSELIVHGFVVIDIKHQDRQVAPLAAFHQPAEMAMQMALVAYRHRRNNVGLISL